MLAFFYSVLLHNQEGTTSEKGGFRNVDRTYCQGLYTIFRAEGRTGIQLHTCGFFNSRQVVRDLATFKSSQHDSPA